MYGSLNDNYSCNCNWTPARLENVRHRLYGQFLYSVIYILRQYSAVALVDRKEKGC